jgi:acetyl esterase/lipase
MSYFRTFFSKPSGGSLFSAFFADRQPSVERAVSYGDHSRHRLDIYRPVMSHHSTPVVVFFYGGGWDSGCREMYGFVGAALAASGFTTVIPDYRLYPEVRYPEFMEDAANAYCWAARNLSGIGSEESPTFVMGHSAGAHIGALLTYDPQYLQTVITAPYRPQGFIGLSGPYGFDPKEHKRTLNIFKMAPTAKLVQPVQQVRKGAVPALLMHGKKDTTVLPLNAVRLSEALSQVGSHGEVIELENARHMDPILALSKPYRRRSIVLDRIKRFIVDLA